MTGMAWIGARKDGDGPASDNLKRIGDDDGVSDGGMKIWFKSELIQKLNPSTQVQICNGTTQMTTQGKNTDKACL